MSENWGDKEELVEEVVLQKEQMSQYQQKRKENRNCVRALEQRKNEKKIWVCSGPFFVKLPREKALDLISKEQKTLEQEISETKQKLNSVSTQLGQLDTDLLNEALKQNRSY
eukprot:gb/GECH01011044.1/.p1 GENE.gb/GECH01011044.1/~~gb/GECH01011044.1/.p1  ORF type:complete len:112 (+),score=36.92 gb/GECH01011044.1/:1-336(+)